MNAENISHAATMVVLRMSKTIRGAFEVICFLYTKYAEGKPPFSSWKFPTESGEKHETRWMTAANGTVRELSKTPDTSEGFIFSALGPRDENGEPKPFLVSRVPGDANKGSDWHDKCVFIIQLNDRSIPNLRTTEKWDAKDEHLSAPEFVEVGELWRRMLERGQPFHRAVLLKVIENLANKSSEVCDRYSYILDDPRTKEAVCSRGRPIEFKGV